MIRSIFLNELYYWPEYGRSEIRMKHSTQGEHHVEFLNVKPGGK